MWTGERERVADRLETGEQASVKQGEREREAASSVSQLHK